METKEYATLMEKYIEFGFPIILENIGETIDNVFSPIIDKNITEEAGMKKIKWGDSDLQYNDEFKFYMTTKLPNPHYSPEICVKVTLINFTVTEKGLIDQIMNVLVKHEKEKEYVNRQKSIESNEMNKEQKKQLEIQILAALEASGENILEDDNTVDILNQSRNDTKRFDTQEEQFQR